MTSNKNIVVPGDTLHPEVILDWLVEKGWFTRHRTGLTYGPKKPPTSRAGLEAYTKAVVMLTASHFVARSGGRYSGQVRFSLGKQS